MNWKWLHIPPTFKLERQDIAVLESTINQNFIHMYDILHIETELYTRGMCFGCKIAVYVCDPASPDKYTQKYLVKCI